MTHASAPGHAHAWSAMRFEFADGHPWVVEACATCGTVRRYRAFERYWDPAAGGERDRRRDVLRATAGTAEVGEASDH